MYDRHLHIRFGESYTACSYSSIIFFSILVSRKCIYEIFRLFLKSLVLPSKVKTKGDVCVDSLAWCCLCKEGAVEKIQEEPNRPHFVLHPQLLPSFLMSKSKEKERREKNSFWASADPFDRKGRQTYGRTTFLLWGPFDRFPKTARLTFKYELFIQTSRNNSMLPRESI